MTISRRTFGRMAAAGFASTAALLAAKKIPIAVQIYSIRAIAPKDLPGCLAEIKKIGYDGVEFAGFYNHPAAEVRKMLDGNGLKVAGSHTGINLLLGDELQKTMEYNKIIGNKNLIVPSLPEKYRANINAWKETADLFTDISNKVKSQGFVVGFHNHAVEFEKMEDQYPFDVLFGNASKDVKAQLDIGHCRRAGADPIQVIKKYKGRLVTVHVKEYSPDNRDAIFGEGIVPWKDIFKAVESDKKVEWYIVEEEAKKCSDDFGCIKSTHDLMRKMGK
jgi:sugar phosphate isomerase/epimerase